MNAKEILMEKYFLYEAALNYISDKWYDKVDAEAKSYHDEYIEKNKNKLLETLKGEQIKTLNTLIHDYALYEEQLRFEFGKYIFYYAFSMGMEFQEAFDKFYE